MDDPTFQTLMARIRAGDPAAAGEMCRRYGDYLRAVVRRRLDARLRPQYDSLDFVQDVWASVLARPTDRPAFDSQEALQAYLARVAALKVAETARRVLGTRKRDVARTVPLDTGDAEPPARSGSPGEVAEAAERWDGLVAALPPGHRAILERLREGYTHEDIARAAGVDPRTVRRVVQRLREVAGL